MRFICIVLLFLFLGGCTFAQKAIVGQTIEEIRSAKDTEAGVLKAGVCAISIGAYHRVNNDSERRALDVLCGGEWERPITADDVRTLRDLDELFKTPE